MEWWVIPEASSSDPNGTFVVVSGTEAEIRAKYGTVAQGPYPTKSAAETAAHNEPGIPGNPGQAIGQAVGLGGILEVGAVLKAFFQQIIRVEMWRSLGWIG